MLMNLKSNVSPANDFPRMTVSEMLDLIGPCPAEALIVGMATDGLPVCYNISQAVGPLFVHAPAGWGKTHLLKALLKTTALMDTGRQKREISPLVLTNVVDEWADVDDHIFVQPISDLIVYETVSAMSIFAEQVKPYQYALLLIDGWEVIHPRLQGRLLQMARRMRKGLTIFTSRNDATISSVTKISQGTHPGWFSVSEWTAGPDGEVLIPFYVPCL